MSVNLLPREIPPPTCCGDTMVRIPPGDPPVDPWVCVWCSRTAPEHADVAQYVRRLDPPRGPSGVSRPAPPPPTSIPGSGRKREA